MPEMRFTIRWPDGSEEQCYSPSSTVADHFAVGESLAVDNFVSRSRVALSAASERVRARYGFACSRAAAQMNSIETRASRFTEGAIEIIAIEPAEGP